jgi:hypothetical protein
MALFVTPRLRRIFLLAIPLGSAFIIVSAGSMGHPAAQNSRAADPQTLPRTMASTDERVAHEPRDRGATYEWLESQATRVTARFPDVVAISERTADADLKTRLTDLVGNDLATFKIHRVDAMNDVLEFRSTDTVQIRPTRRTSSSSRPTLDWASGSRGCCGLVVPVCATSIGTSASSTQSGPTGCPRPPAGPQPAGM